MNTSSRNMWLFFTSISYIVCLQSSSRSLIIFSLIKTDEGLIRNSRLLSLSLGLTNDFLIIFKAHLYHMEKWKLRNQNISVRIKGPLGIGVPRHVLYSPCFFPLQNWIAWTLYPTSILNFINEFLLKSYLTPCHQKVVCRGLVVLLVIVENLLVMRYAIWYHL